MLPDGLLKISPKEFWCYQNIKDFEIHGLENLPNGLSIRQSCLFFRFQLIGKLGFLHFDISNLEFLDSLQIFYSIDLVNVPSKSAMMPK